MHISRVISIKISLAATSQRSCAPQKIHLQSHILSQSAGAACFVAFSVHAYGNLYLPPEFLSRCHMQVSVLSIPEGVHRQKELKMSPALV